MACHVGCLVCGLKLKYNQPDWIYLYNKWFVIKNSSQYQCPVFNQIENFF